MKKPLLSFVMAAAVAFVLPAAEVSAQKELNLQGTIQGSREQPKVLYIVPWQRPDSGIDLNVPARSLLGDTFAPIDRAEFRRELTYFKVLQSNLANKNTVEQNAQE
jgi:hypothetical protein